MSNREGEKVTCRACELSYVPYPLYEFFPDTAGGTGLCQRCKHYEDKHGVGTAPPTDSEALDFLAGVASICG